MIKSKKSTLNKIEESKHLLLAYYDKYGEIPNRDDCIPLGILKVGKSTIARKYGNWENFIKSIGLKPKVEAGNTDLFYTTCGECKKNILKTIGEIKKSKSGKVFCSKSCATTYNNKHKKHGTRRSKAEKYLETYIRENYPKIKLICNDKTIIGSELDFYFPDLKFAIELNGIFHYEPIYGEDKLERIQNNDQQKMIWCYKKGIELAVVDVSHINNLTKKRKVELEGIVQRLLQRVVKRKYPMLESN